MEALHVISVSFVVHCFLHTFAFHCNNGVKYCRPSQKKRVGYGRRWHRGWRLIDRGWKPSGRGWSWCFSGYKVLAGEWVNLCTDAISSYSTSSYNYSCEYERFNLHVPTLNLISHMQSLLLCSESTGGIEWWASGPRSVAVAAVATSVTTCACGPLVWTCYVWTSLYLHLRTTGGCGWTILMFYLHLCTICDYMNCLWRLF